MPPERIEEVVCHYEAVGGRSPLNEITFRQARSLRNWDWSRLGTGLLERRVLAPVHRIRKAVIHALEADDF